MFTLSQMQGLYGQGRSGGKVLFLLRSGNVRDNRDTSIGQGKLGTFIL